jgi:DNA mismatch repair protein MutS
LTSAEAVGFRHAVFRDLEDRAFAGCLSLFARQMRTMRAMLAGADKRWYARQKQPGLLEAVDSYCVAVGCLARDVESVTLRSLGLRRFRDYLMAYLQCESFQSLLAETRQLKSDLSQIQYRIQVDGPRIKVSRYESDPDYAEVVLRTFGKFRQDATRAYEFHFESRHEMNISHVEAEILDRVAWLFPEVFAALEQYCARHRDYLDPNLRRFDREVQFYLAYLEHIARLKRNGLHFCYPELSAESKEIDCHEVFDLALAEKLANVPATPVTNDVRLSGSERILVVTGANQGGKTTFARMVGQLHYLARLGCPVPGRDARLFFCDQLFTHFEREEDLRTLHSKLEDDLVRIHAILERASARSLLVMNETFSSSTLQDALFLSKEIMRRIIDRGFLCVFVTFLDELATLGRSTVSLVATVKAEDPAQRTFKILRQPADGLAYALAIAEKHGLTYERTKERITA